MSPSWSVSVTIKFGKAVRIDCPGFLPKSLFLERLTKDPDTVNIFLLISMLTISARFTPELCSRFGGGKKAADFFMETANVLVADEMFKTELETAQAFFLLGMAEWGKGERNRSAIHMGIAVRIAGVLRLHREATYVLPEDATPDDVVYSEHVSRITLYVTCATLIQCKGAEDLLGDQEPRQPLHTATSSSIVC
jgi:hypothetical protein